MIQDRTVCTFVASGFRCIVGSGGPTLENFNGYIALPTGHKWHGKSWDELPCEVHGGITWAEPRLPWDEEDGDRHWIGFDTCHAGDMVPGLLACNFSGDTFKDEDYVVAELISLAEQAAQA